MKRIISLLLSTLMCVAILAGCNKINDLMDSSSDHNNNGTPVSDNLEPDASESAQGSKLAEEEKNTNRIEDMILEFNQTNGSAVYFTSDISSEGLIAIYQALEAAFR